MATFREYLSETAKDPKNDPWGARDEMVKKINNLAEWVDSVSFIESQMFYDKNTKYINQVVKYFKDLEKGIGQLEKIVKKSP